MDNNNTWLAHHGILGQKWGVRRFQNKDGSLTAAGRKHYAMAGEQSKKMAEKYRKDAEDFKRDAESAEKRYSGKNGHKKWLHDMYGDDYKDAKYMKDVFGVDDVEKHGKEGAKEDAKNIKESNMQLYKHWMEFADQYEQQAKKYLNASSAKDFSKAELKEAEKLVKSYLKDNPAEKSIVSRQKPKMPFDKYVLKDGYQEHKKPTGARSIRG